MAATTVPFTSVGTTFWVCATLPTSDTAPLFTALSWIEVGEVDSIGDQVVTDEVMTRTPLKTGVTSKTKGATTIEPFDIVGGWASGNTGQVALKAARESKLPYAYKVEYMDGSKEFGRALITSRGKSIGDSSAFVGFSVTLDPVALPLEVPMV